jgi:hypothetical protein
MLEIETSLKFLKALRSTVIEGEAPGSLIFSKRQPVESLVEPSPLGVGDSFFGDVKTTGRAIFSVSSARTVPGDSEDSFFSSKISTAESVTTLC